MSNLPQRQPRKKKAPKIKKEPKVTAAERKAINAAADKAVKKMNNNTVTANFQRQKFQRNSAFTTNTKQETVKYMQKWMQDFVLIEGDQPLNNWFREKVQSHKLEATFRLPMQRFRDINSYIGFIIQPDLDATLGIHIPGIGSTTTKDAAETLELNHEVSADSAAPIGTDVWWFDKPITLTENNDPNVYCTAAADPGLGGVHWSATDSRFKVGGKSYKVGGMVLPDEKSTFTFKNTSNSDLVITWFWRSYDAAGNLILTFNESLIAVNAGTTSLHQFTDPNWALMQAAAPNTHKFALGIRLGSAAGALPSFGNGMQMGINFNGAPWTFTGADAWEWFAFFDLMGLNDNTQTAALRAQRATASHERVPIVSCTAKNGTPNIALGGLLTSVQFPGLSTEGEIMRAPETSYSVMSGKKNHASGVRSFQKGLHFHSVPEKFQDFQFQPLVGDPVIKEYLRNGKPKILTSIYYPDAAGTVPTVELIIKIHYEFLTQDLSCPLLRCPGNALQQLETLVSMLQDSPQFFENPTHIERLKAFVKSALTSPTAKKLARDALVGGLELLFA